MRWVKNDPVDRFPDDWSPEVKELRSEATELSANMGDG